MLSGVAVLAGGDVIVSTVTQIGAVVMRGSSLCQREVLFQGSALFGSLLSGVLLFD